MSATRTREKGRVLITGLSMLAFLVATAHATNLVYLQDQKAQLEQRAAGCQDRVDEITDWLNERFPGIQSPNGTWPVELEAIDGTQSLSMKHQDYEYYVDKLDHFQRCLWEAKARLEALKKEINTALSSGGNVGQPQPDRGALQQLKSDALDIQGLLNSLDALRKNLSTFGSRVLARMPETGSDKHTDDTTRK